MSFSSLKIKQLVYNGLALVNVTLGFFFIILLGKKFGLGKETDIYFSSLTIIAYLGFFVKSTSYAYQQYYLEIKNENKQLAYDIYSTLVLSIIIITVLIIVVYFCLQNIFSILDNDYEIFFNFFIFYLLLQNILGFNKIILSLEKDYASVYIVDIIVHLSNIITIYFFANNGIIILIYSTTIATSFVILMQFILYIRAGFKFTFRIDFRNDVYMKIVKDSIKFNAGNLIYGFKDVILVSIFNSGGSGIYSMFSYANKFIGVIMQVVNAPIANIFITESSILFSNNEYKKINDLLRKNIYEMLTLFSISAVFVYFILPFVLYYFLGTALLLNEINSIKLLYVFLGLYFFLYTLTIPYNTVLNFFKLFNFIIYSKTIFLFSISVGYLLIIHFNYSYYLIFYMLILGQSLNFGMYYVKLNKELKSKVNTNF